MPIFFRRRNHTRRPAHEIVLNDEANLLLLYRWATSSCNNNEDQILTLSSIMKLFFFRIPRRRHVRNLFRSGIITIRILLTVTSTSVRRRMWSWIHSLFFATEQSMRHIIFPRMATIIYIVPLMPVFILLVFMAVLIMLMYIIELW